MDKRSRTSCGALKSVTDVEHFGLVGKQQILGLPKWSRYVRNSVDLRLVRTDIETGG